MSFQLPCTDLPATESPTKLLRTSWRRQWRGEKGNFKVKHTPAEKEQHQSTETSQTLSLLLSKKFYRQCRHENATRSQGNNSRRHHYYCCHHHEEAKLVPHFFWTVPCFQITHAGEALGMEEIDQALSNKAATAATCVAQMSHPINH